MEISTSLSAQLIRNTRTQQTRLALTAGIPRPLCSLACVSVHTFVTLPDRGPRPGLREAGGRRGSALAREKAGASAESPRTRSSCGQSDLGLAALAGPPEGQCLCQADSCPRANLTGPHVASRSRGGIGQSRLRVTQDTQGHQHSSWTLPGCQSEGTWVPQPREKQGDGWPGPFPDGRGPVRSERAPRGPPARENHRGTGGPVIRLPGLFQSSSWGTPNPGRMGIAFSKTLR